MLSSSVYTTKDIMDGFQWLLDNMNITTVLDAEGNSL
jgi:hypothetical protein